MACCGLGALDSTVLDHKVIGLWGGVFSTSDTPFIDFIGNGFHADPNFLIVDAPRPLNLGSCHGLQLSGAMSIFAISEPGTLPLLLAPLAFALRKRVYERV